MPLIAVRVGVVCPPILALATGGRFYLKTTEHGVSASRFADEGAPSDRIYECIACNAEFERPDMLYSAYHGVVVCSLCRALERLGAARRVAAVGIAPVRRRVVSCCAGYGAKPV